MATNYVGSTDLLYILNKIKAVLEAGYVKVEDGKGLSTNDFTTILKNKLDSIAEGAEVNVQADWNETDTSSDAYIKNKPTIPDTITLDDTLSNSSTNAVQNKAIKSYIDAAVSAITSVQFKKVTVLPPQGANGIIYLVPKNETTSKVGNIYEEYIWITDDTKFEKIGETDIDLSGYVRTADLVEITTTDIDAMFKTVFRA